MEGQCGHRFGDVIIFAYLRLTVPINPFIPQSVRATTQNENRASQEAPKERLGAAGSEDREICQ